MKPFLELKIEGDDSNSNIPYVKTTKPTITQPKITTKQVVQVVTTTTVYTTTGRYKTNEQNKKINF